MLLSIAIPTYNRGAVLLDNLNKINFIVDKYDLVKKVMITVVDNGSTDDTVELINGFKSQVAMQTEVFKNSENLGLSKNVQRSYDESDTEFVMFLGDDDYISEKYLCNLIEILEQKKASCIIPSYKNISLEGRDTGRGRDLNKKSKFYKAGFKNCFVNSWRGHQLSGLVIPKCNLFDVMKKAKIENLYPQIFMISYSCLQHDTYHFTDYPILVTRPPQTNKNWGYGNDGLLSHVFENYKNLEGITSLQRMLLEIRFIDMQYWRIGMYLKKGPFAFFKALISISKSSNTTVINKILLWIAIPLIFIKKFVVLLISGELFKTLKTKVDI